MSKKRKTTNSVQQATPRPFGRILEAPWVSIAMVCVVGLLAYSNTLQSSFHLDDDSSITYNPTIKQLSDLKGIWLSTPTRFLTYLSFALNYHFGGLNVLGYHIFNLVVHLLAAVVVWLLVQQVLRTPALRGQVIAKQSKILALLAALFFVAHPLQTEAVTYISQRAASLASLFYLLSVYFYGSARLSQLQGGSQRSVLALFGASGLAGLMALFSKEISLSLPFILLAYEFYFLRDSGKINWKFFLAVLALFVLIPLVLIKLNLLSLSDAPSVSATRYLLTQPRVIVTYLRLLVLPIDQNLDYDFRLSSSLYDTSTFLSFLLVIGLAAAAYKLFARQRVLSFCIAWFVLTLAPESSFIPLLDPIFEHRLYLAMFGFCLFLVVILFSLLGRRKLVALVLAGLTVTVVLGWLTYDRNKIWKDELTLWTDVVQKSPLKPRGYNNRGRALAEAGRKQEALNDFSRALALDPNFADVYNNRSNIYVQLGMADRALADCDSALAHATHLQYQVAMIYFNRGTAFILKGELDRAIRELSNALLYDRNHESAHFNRAIAYARTGQYEKAIEDYTAVITNNPIHAKAFNNRGQAYRELGKLNEALADFNHSIALTPDFGAAYLNRGIIFSLRGQLDEALADLTTGLRLLPGSKEGYYHRGTVYYRRKKYNESVADFTRAIQQDPGYAPAYLERAQALIATQQYKQAAEDLQRAKQLGLVVDPTLSKAVRKGLH